MAEHRTIAPDEDPVCGMTVDVAEAVKKGLAREYEGRQFVFCGKGCYLEFGDDPEAFLAEGYTAEM